MNKIINKINNSKHIVVIATDSVDSICAASAFYTYLLKLHKKVSFYSDNLLERRLSFIPWSEKMKNNFPSSADLAIIFDYPKNKMEIGCEFINFNIIDDSVCISKMVYCFFKDNEIKINNKMAISLYSGILDKTNGFLNDVDGTIFAVVKELLELGIDTKICNKYIMHYVSLASFRLKSMIQANMKLLLNAKVALFVVKDNDMLSSGAMESDCEDIISEALFLPTVRVVILLREYDDFNIKILLKSDGSLDLVKIASQFSVIGKSTRVEFDFFNKNQIKEKKLELIYKEIEVESKK